MRLNVTASDGSVQNTDASVNVFDLYDLGTGDRGPVPDDFVFYGDSITAGGDVPVPVRGRRVAAGAAARGGPVPLAGRGERR